MPVSRYVALRTVKHSGVDFLPGTPLALSDVYAGPLVDIGAIAAQAGPLPQMPVVPGPVVREQIDSGSGSKVPLEVETLPFGGVAARVVVSSAPPDDNDGLPDNTIYLQLL